MKKWYRKMFLLSMAAVFMMLSSCGVKKEDDSEILQAFCSQYASEYEVIESREDEAIQVSVEAPDFGKIAAIISEQDSGDSITAREIKKAAKQYPDYKKEYTFWVKTEDEEVIEQGFLTKVSEELIVEAIQNVKYTEAWGTEE